jgi:transposase
MAGQQLRGFDETTLRCGPAGTKKYVLAAVTESCSLFFLGALTLESFREFGIMPVLIGVVVSDRYQNYFHDGWKHITGHQVCLAHYPDTVVMPIPGGPALAGGVTGSGISA